MKKAVCLLIVLSFVFSLPVVAAYPVDDAGRFTPMASSTDIICPSNGTDALGFRTLNITSQIMFAAEPTNITFLYSIDGIPAGTIPVASTVPVKMTRYWADGTTDVMDSFPIVISAWTALPELSEGSHNITVKATYNCTEGNCMFITDVSTVFFSINGTSASATSTPETAAIPSDTPSPSAVPSITPGEFASAAPSNPGESPQDTSQPSLQPAVYTVVVAAVITAALGTYLVKRKRA